MRLIKGRDAEDVDPARTLHPSVSSEVIEHLRAHGYIVADPDELQPFLETEIEVGRYGKESAAIARGIVNKLRRNGK